MRSIAHAGCLSHQPDSTGQSSMASTGLHPRAISGICGQHGLTRAARPVAMRSARPCCRMSLPASRRTRSANGRFPRAAVAEPNRPPDERSIMMMPPVSVSWHGDGIIRAPAGLDAVGGTFRQKGSPPRPAAPKGRHGNPGHTVDGSIGCIGAITTWFLKLTSWIEIGLKRSGCMGGRTAVDDGTLSATACRPICQVRNGAIACPTPAGAGARAAGAAADGPKAGA
jgi:hypothetical protein